MISIIVYSYIEHIPVNPKNTSIDKCKIRIVARLIGHDLLPTIMISLYYGSKSM